MTLNYRPIIHIAPSDFPPIARNGFIRCDVLLHETKTIRHLGYCLHCRRIFSLSWSKKHSRWLRNASVDVSLNFKLDKVELFSLDILSELELLFEKGRFSFRSTSTQRRANSQTTAHLDNVSSIFDEQVPLVNTQETRTSDSLQLPIQDVSSRNNNDSYFNSIHESIQECLLKYSFCGSEFDAEEFLSFAESMMTSSIGTYDFKTTNALKAEIVSSMFKKLSTLLSLSKSQNDQLLRFWKTMILFINPFCEDVVQQIHASYNSRVRQALRDTDLEKTRCKRQMESCSFFFRSPSTHR